ncbi:hypothetical protein BLOT_007225 [Blomia tropicalis]|nr:hypothetical protein BLOT_007225 [Blomia tropicalis]
MVNISLANAASAVAKDVEDVIEGVESKVESAQDAVADTLNLDGKINPIIQAQTSLLYEGDISIMVSLFLFVCLVIGSIMWARSISDKRFEPEQDFTIFIRNPEEGKEEEGGQHTPVTGSAPNP